MHFGTVATSAEVDAFTTAKVRWVRDVDTKGTINDITDDEFEADNEGRRNNPGNKTALDFYMLLSKGLRPMD